MKLKLQSDSLAPYLESCEIIDFEHNNPCAIKDLSHELLNKAKNKVDYIKILYEYVRDQISHSADISGKTVTCKASEVLKAKEGICYAKSHLLAALLRCSHIPAGFCYQRLILNDDSAPQLVIHGLNAVYVEELGKWIRLDARGNKQGVNAQFSLEQEQLAFPVRAEEGEEDIPVIFAYPDKNVVQALRENKSLEMLWANLPATLNWGG